jgi:hypothetical protein
MQALAVVVQTKAGIGLGIQFGGGFVINRLGPNKWSAPSYFTIRNASAGLTLGACQGPRIWAWSKGACPGRRAILNCWSLNGAGTCMECSGKKGSPLALVVGMVSR